MLSRTIRRLLLFSFLLAGVEGILCRAQIPQPPQQLRITSLGDSAVPLGGQWQFQIGDDPAWASPAYDDADWTQIDIGRPWGNQGFYAYTGFAWYRRHLDFAKEPAGATNVALFLPRAGCLYEIYWNGRMVGHFGEMPGRPAQSSSPPGSFRLGQPEKGVLAIRVWTRPFDSSSPGNDRGLMATIGLDSSLPENYRGPRAVPWIGNPQSIADLQTMVRASAIRDSLLDNRADLSLRRTVSGRLTCVAAPSQGKVVAMDGSVLPGCCPVALVQWRYISMGRFQPCSLEFPVSLPAGHRTLVFAAIPP